MKSPQVFSKNNFSCEFMDTNLMSEMGECYGVSDDDDLTTIVWEARVKDLGMSRKMAGMINAVKKESVDNPAKIIVRDSIC